MKLEDNQLIHIKGGAVSAAFLNSLSRFIDTLLNLGEILGNLLGKSFRRSCRR